MNGLDHHYLSAEAIQRFCADHPTEWLEAYAHLSRRGQLADQASMSLPHCRPPVATMMVAGEFFRCRRIPATQEQLFMACCEAWARKNPDWYAWLWSSKEPYLEALRAKTYRNMWPAFIDGIHVQALFIESGKFRECRMSSTDDVVLKCDLLAVCYDGTELRIGLVGPGEEAAENSYFRKGGEGIIRVQMSWDRPKNPGNKRWFCAGDFEVIFQLADQHHPSALPTGAGRKHDPQPGQRPLF